MNQTLYEDRCTECQEPCSRLRLGKHGSTLSQTSCRFVSSCCFAAPMAVKRGT